MILASVAWWQWVGAAAIFLVILVGGFTFLRSIATTHPKERIEPEDVEELDVFFVCGECGTEFQVTRLGVIQVLRHCGEPMRIDWRPRERRAGG